MPETYKRTKIGQIFFNAIVKAGLFVARRKVLFYLLSYTWGIITTVIGWLMFGFAKLFLRKSISYSGKFFTSFFNALGYSWGGVSMGQCFFFSVNYTDEYEIHLKCHELGHSYQSAVLGPFALLFVSLPSVIRYWQQNIATKKNKPTKPYDLAWWEGSASEIGETLLSESTNKDFHFYTKEFKKNPNFGKEL